jgi:hypothetical protein
MSLRSIGPTRYIHLLIPSNDGDEWLLDDDQGNDVLQTIALQALGFAESMSGDGSRGPYDGIPRSKDYFATLLQQPDERFRYVFRSVSIKIGYFNILSLRVMMFRLGQTTFDRLVCLLADNPLFTSKG